MAVGWLINPDARPSFMELEVIVSDFLSDPLRYILTVVRYHLLLSRHLIVCMYTRLMIGWRHMTTFQTLN